MVRMCRTNVSTVNAWSFGFAPPLASTKMRKCCEYPGSFGTGCARTTRWLVARWTGAPDRARSRRAHSSASTFVGSDTTSVMRSADSTRFWPVSATAELAPSGATGDSSSASNPPRPPAGARRSRGCVRKSTAAGAQNPRADTAPGRPPAPGCRRAAASPRAAPMQVGAGQPGRQLLECRRADPVDDPAAVGHGTTVNRDPDRRAVARLL